MERILDCYSQGARYGSVFNLRDGDRAKALDFQVPILEKLVETQLDPLKLNLGDVAVVDEYCLSHLFR
jgi:hypothetical protein